MKTNKQLSIFVVEDNLIYQQLIAKQLESICYAINFFTSGEACLEKIKMVMPDVIILDNNLDGDLTGLETLKILRVLHEELYVVLFSTEPGLNSDKHVALYGNFEYVEKNEAGFRKLKERVCESGVYQLKVNSR